MEDYNEIEKCFGLFYSFLKEKYGMTPFLEQAKVIVEKVCREKKNSQLRSLRKELNTWYREMLSSEEKVEFANLLIKENVKIIALQYEEIILGILQNEMICNKEEYELLLNYVGSADAEKDKEIISKINKLLRRYDKDL